MSDTMLKFRVLARYAASGLALALLPWTPQWPAHAQPATAPAADWAKVEAAAKKEGAVVLYTTSNSEIVPTIMKKFEARYGIPVDILRGRGSELRERVRTEITSGRTVGDVFHSGNTLRAVDLGQLQKHEPLPNTARLIPLLKDDGYFSPTNIAPFGVLMNTDLVKQQDEPKVWADLLDPKWRGKILVDDPRAPGQGNATVMVLEQKFGREFLDKFAAQNITISTDNAAAERRVAQGEYAFYVGFSLANVLRMRGLPIKGFIPAEGAPYTASVATIIKDAPHPNAARLLLNFILDDAAQTVFSDQANISATGLVSPAIPEDIRKLTQAKLLAEADPFQMDDKIALYKQIFK